MIPVGTGKRHPCGGLKVWLSERSGSDVPATSPQRTGQAAARGGRQPFAARGGVRRRRHRPRPRARAARARAPPLHAARLARDEGLRHGGRARGAAGAGDSRIRARQRALTGESALAGAPWSGQHDGWGSTMMVRAAPCLGLEFFSREAEKRAQCASSRLPCAACTGNDSVLSFVIRMPPWV
eukprot:gene10073-biopygen1730